MHFLTIVVLPQEVPHEEDPINEVLHHLLRPYYFDLEPEGPLHKEYYDAQTIEKFAALFGAPPENLTEIAAKMRQEWGGDDAVDESGLYSLTTLNPNRKLDYWILHNVDTDVWLVRDMPRDLYPVAVVTPDGRWHHTGEEWRPGDLTASELAAISERVHALIDQYPERLAVALDCHA